MLTNDILEGPSKSDSQEGSSDADKDETQGKDSARKSLVAEDERKISVFIPSQELTLHNVRSSEQ